MLEAAQSAALEPTEQDDGERDSRISKRARQIAKQTAREVDALVAAIEIPTAPEMPA
jgi:hypothetical protein